MARNSHEHDGLSSFRCCHRNYGVKHLTNNSALVTLRWRQIKPFSRTPQPAKRKQGKWKIFLIPIFATVKPRQLEQQTTDDDLPKTDTCRQQSAGPQIVLQLTRLDRKLRHYKTSTWRTHLSHTRRPYFSFYKNNYNANFVKRNWQTENTVTELLYKTKLALQVARKVSSCNMALTETRHLLLQWQCLASRALLWP